MIEFIFSVICLCLRNTKGFDFYIKHNVYIIDYAI